MCSTFINNYICKIWWLLLIILLLLHFFFQENTWKSVKCYKTKPKPSWSIKTKTWNINTKKELKRQNNNNNKKIYIYTHFFLQHLIEGRNTLELSRLPQLCVFSHSSNLTPQLSVSGAKCSVNWLNWTHNAKSTSYSITIITVQHLQEKPQSIRNTPRQRQLSVWKSYCIAYNML